MVSACAHFFVLMRMRMCLKNTRLSVRMDVVIVRMRRSLYGEGVRTARAHCSKSARIQRTHKHPIHRMRKQWTRLAPVPQSSGLFFPADHASQRPGISGMTSGFLPSLAFPTQNHLPNCFLGSHGEPNTPPGQTADRRPQTADSKNAAHGQTPTIACACAHMGV